jgi:hypothetical protein
VPHRHFTQADWATNGYYPGVAKEIVDLCGGTSEIILCLKDMVRSIRRFYPPTKNESALVAHNRRPAS